MDLTVIGQRIKFQKPFHFLLTSLFEKWYDSGEKVGAINILEGIVLRNSLLIMLRLIIPPISAALFPITRFINTTKGHFIYGRKMDRRNTNWSLDCVRPIHNKIKW